MVARMTRVVLADDQTLVRVGLRVLFDVEPDIEVVGEASHGLAAVQMVRRLHPDIVLMDLRMPVLDGIEATRTIAADPMLAATRVVVLTTFEADEDVFAALRAGASGFLLKDAEPADIVRAVRVVAAGDGLLSPSVTRRLVAAYTDHTRPRATAHPHIDSLTDRERQVVELVAEGMSNDEIADRLHLSPATVRTHVSRAMLKLSARDRAQLVVFAFRSGLAGGP